MRRRRFAVIAGICMVLSAPVGNASLEADCYVAGGYFGATYFGDNYLDESCLPSDPPSPVSDGNKYRNLFRFGDMP